MASAKQQKLRQLMKEKKASSENAKINSPIARYNAVGQLSCAICNVPVKSNILWSAHVHSKKHKETVALLKAQKESAAAAAINKDKSVSKAMPTTATSTPTQKRKEEMDDAKGNQTALPAKRLKVDNAKNVVITSSVSTELLAEAENDSADMEEGDNANNNADDTAKQSLPADFFDNNQQTVAEADTNDVSQDEVVTKEKERSDSSSKLPQGFFDDPKVDAKVRKVEYKDPELEEWEKFKKSIIEENKISDTIMDEEDDEAKVDREITELSEQSECYSKAEILRQKQELYRQKRSELKRQQVETVSMTTKTTEPDQTSDSEQEELEEFLNWRSKVV